MHSEQLNNSQPVAVVCPVEDSVGNLETTLRDFLSCPWCGEPLPASKTKPRTYCNEAHEKAFKRARCVSKQKHQARKLADAEAAWSRFTFIPQLGTFFDTRVKPKQPELIKDRRSNGSGVGVHAPSGSLATTPRKVRHEVNFNDRPTVPEPTKVLPEFRPFPPETPLFIGPLWKNERRKAGRV